MRKEGNSCGLITTVAAEEHSIFPPLFPSKHQSERPRRQERRDRGPCLFFLPCFRAVFLCCDSIGTKTVLVPSLPLFFFFPPLSAAKNWTKKRGDKVAPSLPAESTVRFATAFFFLLPPLADDPLPARHKQWKKSAFSLLFLSLSLLLREASTGAVRG